MKFVKLSLVLLVLLTLSAAALDITLNQRYAEDTTVPINGTCNEPMVPVAFQIDKGRDTVWLGQSLTSNESIYQTVFTPAEVGNYTLYVACSGENSNKEFCIGTSSQCSLELGGAIYGVTSCPTNQCTRRWGRLNAGETDTFDTQENYDILSVTFTVRSTVTGTPSLTLKQIDQLPADVPLFPEKSYKMFHLQPNPVFDAANVTVSFRVEKKWLDNNRYGPNDIKLYRYGNAWVPLKTVSKPQRVMSGKTYMIYEAESPGLSYFIIGAKKAPEPAATCDDGIKNQGEQRVDCGGPCKACPTVIPIARCTDGIQNQGETGIDCGGPCAACVVQGPTCRDGIRNQGETGIDCGGPCAACVVQGPTCSDGIRNQGEQGVDCGGPCVTACASCTDNIQNQGEQGIDCGGPCPLCEEKVPFFKDSLILGSIGGVVLLVLVPIIVIVIVIVLLVVFFFKRKSGARRDELAAYVQRQLAAGHSRGEIAEAARKSGWKEKDIEKAFK